MKDKPTESWQPSATLHMLQQRANVLTEIRGFFAARGVLEVDVPSLASTTVSDVNLESLQVFAGRRAVGFLQTSPEYFMKRLLAAGSGPIYSLSKAFRSEEVGAHHNLEFTMLEWYRPGFDDRALAAEVISLCRLFAPDMPVQYHSYQELFQTNCGIDPHTATDSELAQLARTRLNVPWQNEPRSLWLDALFTHLVEPELRGELAVVTDYPACQCALSRLATDLKGNRVARRFEVYWNGLELANGYWELCDSSEQRRRFEEDNWQRQLQGKATVVPDEHLLAALSHGLPDCAGVALGIDRLLMSVAGKSSIGEVLSFVGAR